MSDSVRPHRWQPTRLPHPWDSPGKNTGVGCHFLLQCMKVKSESEDTQSCLTLSDPMGCSPPGSCIHGIFQARVLEWGAIVPDGNSARRGKNDTGESVFPETDPISLFSGLFIYFLLHIGMNTESRRVSRPDPCHNQVLHIKVYKGLRGFTSSSGHEAC